MALVSFEAAFNDTIQSLADRKFRLHSDTTEAVQQYLRAARLTYRARFLEEATTYSEYTQLLHRHVKAIVDDPSAPPMVFRGYQLAERILFYHIRVQAGDQRQQQRIERVVTGLKLRVKDEPELVQTVAAIYANVYRKLTSVDLFATDGHPVGRAAMAAKVVADQFKDRPQWRQITSILNSLRSMVQEIDQPTS